MPNAPTFFARRLAPYALVFLCIQTLLRLSLVARSLMDVDLSAYEIANMLLRGLWLDMATCAFVVLPVALVVLAVPPRLWATATGRWAEHLLRFVFVYALLFDAVAEHLFWTEFTTRFNFIAVDYLVYTNEVIGNIVESYPLAPLLGGIGAAAAAFVFGLRRIMPLPAQNSATTFRLRLAGFAIYMLVTLGLYASANISHATFNDNAEAAEVAANGIYNLFYAFSHNEIDYDRFYAQRPRRQTQATAQRLFREVENKTVIEDGSLIRIITPKRPEKHKNVIIVVMESMSAQFMAAFGNTEGLTPNLDRLAEEGLFFTKAYATGTRTVRGLEAVTLSIPPTPGQSIVRRPGNENLYSLGFVFKDRGYDTTFLYGGYGYFDNMNAFFAGNGFDVVDRTAFAKGEYGFANVWGIADDDVFAKSVRMADASYKAGKPFMQMIMTTSNHRPYTYPEGRISLPPKSGRTGGVMYADYSVGKLVEWAREKPWFKDTVFVFVADHTAGASGKVELAPEKYHIPLIVYAPDFIKPRTYDKVMSQIDTAPVLLGLLDFHYRSKFYGEDVINDADEVPHAFISNYQKVALVKDGTITVLAPKREVDQIGWASQNPVADENANLTNETIGYYQSASWWRDTLRRIPSTIQ